MSTACRRSPNRLSFICSAALRHAPVTALLAATLLACGKDGGSDPQPKVTGPALRLVAGGTGTDTIGGTLAQALVVEVRGNSAVVAGGR